MRRVWVSVTILALGASIFGLANYWTPHLVNHVVCNAFLQKVPPEFPQDQIRRLFAEAFAEASRDKQTQKRYTQLLFDLSQRLEKLQRLSVHEAEELLERIRSFPKDQLQGELSEVGSI